MYIKTIRIRDIRCFGEELVQFNCPNDGITDDFLPNVNLFLGNNGIGKSTLLKSLALVTSAPIIHNSGITPYFLVRRSRHNERLYGDVFAEIDLLTGSENDTWLFIVTVERRSDYESIASTGALKSDSPRPIAFGNFSDSVFEPFFMDTSSQFFVVGYSSSRRVEDVHTFNPNSARKSRTARYQRVAGLFEEHVNLAPFSAWLSRLKERNGQRQAHFDEAIYLLNELLPESTTISTDSVDENNVYFVQDGLELPFEALSDGYRSYLGWISDLLYHLQSVCPSDQKLVDIPGIVMVDEVDLHLHPEWQRRVVPILARTFPKIQWMLTTHSPIVVGTLHPKNIYIMEQSENGTTVRQSEERSYGLNAEQILTSDYFGLTTTRAPGAVNRLKELSDKIQQGDKEAVFEMMEELTRKNLGER